MARLFHSLSLLGAAGWWLAAAGNVPLPGFQSPASTYGTRFRYWCPDASVDPAQVSRDIESLSAIGAGGLEFIPFYNYGFRSPLFPSWDGGEFGFGGAKFNELFKTTLKAAKDNGLIFDFSIGANQGQGVVAEPLTPGLAMQLVYSETTVTGGERFDGAVPEANSLYNFGLGDLAEFMHHHENWGPSKLVAVVAGGVKSSIPVEDPNNPEYRFSNIVLDESSLIDLAEFVLDGTLSWTAPTDHDNYTLFAIYERFTNQRSLDATENPRDLIGNGSWITDHFSAAGARLVVDFWENNILDVELRELMQAASEFTWEDSLEMSSALWWSSGFLERFEANRGYNPTKYLPIMFSQAHVMRAEYPPYNKTYLLDTMDPFQNKYLQDYRLTLTDGYIEYLGTLEEWAQSLGLAFSAQVAYNLPIDMAASVPAVGAPELETLVFPTVDHHLHFVGAAHLSGRHVISTELGTTLNGAYSTSVRELMNMARDALAAGVNNIVVHGMAYGGEYLSTWPGYTVQRYGFGDSWGRRSPDWLYINETMAYTARNVFVLRSGVPKRDVAFYRYDEPRSMTPGYESDDLRSAGYSYDYLASANLASTPALVSDRVLAPQGPAYRALVFNDQAYISPEAAVKVLEFAENGLPIIVLGGSLPNVTIGTAGQDVVSEAMASVAAHKENVKFLSGSESVADVLAGLGVRPRVSIASQSAATIYSVWRSTDQAQLAFLVNKGETDTVGLTFEVGSDMVPFKLDAWTGEQLEVVVYERTDDGVTISTTFATEQTMIFAFVPSSEDAQKTHVTSVSDNVEKVERGLEGELIAFIKDGDMANLSRSDGKHLRIKGQKCAAAVPRPVHLNHWNLTVESWVPEIMEEGNSRTVKEPINLGLQDGLRNWTAIDEVRNVSGVGIYTTTFSLPEGFFRGSRTSAVILSFGPVLNTIRAWVNGKRLPAIDTSNAEVDISDYLAVGGDNNSLRVEVSSNLFNAVKARSDLLSTFGESPLFPAVYDVSDFQPFGLVGPVTLRPLRKAVVKNGE